MTLSFAKIYCIGLYQLSVIFTMVYMEHVTLIDCSTSNFIFTVAMKGAGKAISVCKQVIAM